MENLKKAIASLFIALFEAGIVALSMYSSHVTLGMLITKVVAFASLNAAYMFLTAAAITMMILFIALPFLIDLIDGEYHTI